MKKLTDDKLCEALKNDTYYEAKDLKEMKKQPNVQEMYLKLNKYEKLEAELGCPLDVFIATLQEEKKGNREKMTVEEYLRYHTEVGDLVEFTENGWRIGITYIDHEDLFIRSLNPSLLQGKVCWENKEKKLYVGDRKEPTIIEVKHSIEVEY